MTRAANKLGTDLMAELQRRSLTKDGDVYRLLQEFQDSAPAGACVLTSEGTGEVSILVPLRDGYDGPQKLQVTTHGNTTNIIDEIEASGNIDIEGVSFRQFVLEPLRYKRALPEGGARPLVGVRGVGGDEWKPLGFDGWFWEDLLLLTDVAVRGGMEVRPDVEVDPSDPDWKPLEPKQRDALENVLGRRVGQVVHTTTIKKAMARARGDDGAVAGALRSLTMVLGDAQENQDEGQQARQDGLELAKPVLTKLFGEAYFDPNAFPATLLKMARDRLSEIGLEEDAKFVSAALGSPDKQDERLCNALDKAFGGDFSATRAPTLELLDRIIDHHGESLSFDEMDGLRTLREKLDYAIEVDLFGDDLAHEALSTHSADAKLRELHQYLQQGTGLDDTQVFQLASQLHAALNVPSSKPALIVLTGKGGSSADTLFERARTLCGDKTIDVQESDLRMDDPVGYLVGSGADQPGVARGVLVREAPNAGRFVATFKGLQSLGAGVSDGEERAAARNALWAFFTQVKRDGWFRGYNPDDPEKATGAKIETGGGVFLLRTTQSRSELQRELPAEIWEQIAPNVVSFDNASERTVLAELKAAMSRFLTKEYDLADVDVQLADSVEAFLKDLLAAGMNGAVLQEMVKSQVLPRIFYAHVDGHLTPRVRIEMMRGLTRKELGELKSAWLDGNLYPLNGVGTSPFAVFDAGRVSSEGNPVPTTKLERKLDLANEMDRLRGLIVELQTSATADDAKIKELVEINRRVFQRAEGAEAHNDALKWLNERAVWEIEDLKRLNELANQTIVSLRSDLADANDRIESLNNDLDKAVRTGKKLKDELAVAIQERDAIHSTLREVEHEFAQGVQAFGAGHTAADPMETFRMIHAQAGRSQNRYHHAMLEQALAVAAAQCLERARQIRDTRTNKFAEIAQLAKAYVDASQAIGLRPSRAVLQGMEVSARLSGYGNNNQMAAEWRRIVGEASAYRGRDPGPVSNTTRNILRRLGIQI